MHGQELELEQAALGDEHVRKRRVANVGLQLEHGHLAHGILVAAEPLDELGDVDVV